MRLVVFCLLAVLSVTAYTSEPPVNHCQDSAVNHKWAQLREDHRNSDIWQRVFALRVGLCTLVDQGKLSVHRATRIFERQRTAAAQELKDKGRRRDFGA